MALDFPNAPTLNQTFTAPNGTIWLWDGVKWTAITSTSPYTGQGNVGRNLLHNPLFSVAQRGAGPFTVAGYTLDRWAFGIQTSTATISQIQASDADRAGIGDEAVQYIYQSVGVGTAGTSDYIIGLTQTMEGVRRLSGKTVTLSFWARAGSGTPKIGLEFYQTFGTGGSPSATVTNIGLQAFTLSGTWTRYSSTVSVPSTAGKTFGTTPNTDGTSFRFWQSAGSSLNTNASSIGVQSFTLQLWGVQLEIGSVATPLEKPDPRYDLANCQRFFEIGNFQFYGSVSAGNAIGFTQGLSVVKRAAPTITTSGVSTVNLSGMSYAAGGTNAVVIYATAVATGGFTHTGNYQASADL